MSEMSVTAFKETQKKTKEERVQLQVCDYLRMAYPDVIFTCDLASGLHLPVYVGKMHKRMRSSRGLPDLSIDKPKTVDKSILYCGLRIEIKKDGIRRKDGTIPPKWCYEVVGKVKVKYDHHAEQEKILRKLRQLGYFAEFGVGFDECKNLIDNYLQ